MNWAFIDNLNCFKNDSSTRTGSALVAHQQFVHTIGSIFVNFLQHLAWTNIWIHVFDTDSDQAYHQRSCIQCLTLLKDSWIPRWKCSAAKLIFGVTRGLHHNKILFTIWFVTNLVCDIIHDDDAMGTPVVAAGDGAKPFLPNYFKIIFPKHAKTRNFDKICTRWRGLVLPSRVPNL